MPRIVVPAFFDPTNTASSLAASPSRFINTYTESVAPGHGKSPVWRERTPGIRPRVTFPTGPVRGLFQTQLRCFAVSGPTFGEVIRASDGTYSLTHLHDISNDEQGVSFCSNGSGGGQIFLISMGHGYIYNLNTNTLTQISDSHFPNPARACEYLNGFFLVLHGNTREFRWSAAENGLVWPGLNVAERSEASDDLVSMLRVHEELWLIGERTSEVWRLVADGNNLFEPIPGVLIEHGGIGISAPQRIDNSVMWVGRNDDGHGIIWRADGYTPVRKSTFAIDTVIQAQSPLLDTRAYRSFVYQNRGHVFYCFLMLRNPDVESTLVYDVTMDQWHEWATWRPAEVRWVPHTAGSHVFVFNTHLVGSRFDGTIYELSQDYEDESIIPVTPPPPPPPPTTFSATGGTITTSGGRTFHSFGSSGTFTVTSGSAVVDYLLVGAGGAGGGLRGGGGGAGGYVPSSAAVTVGAYAIVVGTGSAGADGGSSTGFGGTAHGGGRGGDEGVDGHAGASGGGGSGNGQSGGSATQGQAGGGGATGSGTPNAAGGGGGGTVGSGDAANDIDAGHGGAGGFGATYTFTGTSYAGGGGGNGDSASGVGRDGGGDGGAGGNPSTPGTDGTGGGGGGGESKRGGNGIVVVSYPTP